MSIVTVFNDAKVRHACLDRSIEAHRDEAPAVDYVAVDNTAGRFRSAGAALNHGADEAQHDYLVFVHQDVYLHSLKALEEAAGVLADDESIGLVGATGVTSQGHFLGRIRDRVILAGEPVREPMPVDCVDEVLFMIPRRLLKQHPITEEPELAWHAYAVDLGLRLRAKGLRVCAINIPITHNSLTVNVNGLDVAYDALAANHPQAMPVVTPQGKIGDRPRPAERISAVRGIRAHRWRYRWLRQSPSAYAGSRAAGGSPCLLGDIRFDVDQLLSGLSSERPLFVVNVDHHPTFDDERADSLTLTRADRPIRLTSRPLEQIARRLPREASGGPTLVTNLRLPDLCRVASQLPNDRRVLGFDSVFYWMVLGVAPAALPIAWRSRRATPLGMPALDG